MSRAVVHKTKGKLDLRSLTVFGLNSKPATDTPIGYFGTGLKYAVAVLARHNIPITFWIDGKRWTVEQDDTKFRDKSFRALYLKRDRGKMLPAKVLPLPFTTELGKNWELWQAFRELESNTRDEKGETFQMHNAEGEPSDIRKMVGPNTAIIVQDERYVECFLNKDLYFLPDGITQPNIGNERIQVFPRKSNAVYYRSIKVLDLKEPSENTYNILSGVKLTEDRTVGEWDANYEIQQYLAQTEDKEVVHRAVAAPPKSHERRFDYEYFSRSDTFLDTVEELGEDATDHARDILRRDRPLEKPKETYANWIFDFIAAIERGDNDRVVEVIKENEPELLKMLTTEAHTMEAFRKAGTTWNKVNEELLPSGSITGRMQTDGSHIEEVERERRTIQDPPTAGSQDDDIPF